MTWIILLWIFQGYSLFSYQCSLLFSATLICYHIFKCLSTTFLFFFFSSFKLMCCRFATALIFYQIFFALSRTFFHFLFRSDFVLCDSLIILSNRQSFVNNFFKKIRTTSTANSSGERGIWTLAPVDPTYTLSRGTSSATWVFLQSSLFDNMMLFDAFVTHIW